MPGIVARAGRATGTGRAPPGRHGHGRRSHARHDDGRDRRSPARARARRPERRPGARPRRHATGQPARPSPRPSRSSWSVTCATSGYHEPPPPALVPPPEPEPAPPPPTAPPNAKGPVGVGLAVRPPVRRRHALAARARADGRAASRAPGARRLGGAAWPARRTIPMTAGAGAPDPARLPGTHRGGLGPAHRRRPVRGAHGGDRIRPDHGRDAGHRIDAPIQRPRAHHRAGGAPPGSV
jgi:hypothetical protein